MTNLERISAKVKTLEAQERRLAYRLERARGRDAARNELEDCRRALIEWNTRLLVERRAIHQRRLMEIEKIAATTTDRLTKVNLAVEVNIIRAQLAEIR